jgi:diguanylate cyclase (GGDEF)-like protein
MTLGPESPKMLTRSLSRARRDHTEQPEAALAAAVHALELARSTGELGVAARALALRGFVAVHRGDLPMGITLAVEAADHAERSGDAGAQAEVATLKALLSFFSGAYAEAVTEARLALTLADRDGDLELALFVHRMTCPVLGNLGFGGAPDADLQTHLERTLALAGDDPREQALSRNDLATMFAAQGHLEPARRELDLGFALLEQVPDARFSRAVLYITSAETRLASGDGRGALIDSRRGLELLVGDSSPNPYLLGAAVQTEIRGLLALGDLDRAREIGEGTLERLGDRIPQTRSLILTTLADALAGAGRLEEAYMTLGRAAELERTAFRELVDLQSNLERATLETVEARRRSDSLMAKNQELADAHAELERRSAELERLQDQLRDQAERDWLTGLHNRRFLARQIDSLDARALTEPVSAAILDIDHFKTINDRFGHSAGDRVLVEIATVLEWLQGPDNVIMRSGGEEFIVVMAGTDEHSALTRCEQVRAQILQHNWYTIAPGLSVSVSIGVGATRPGAGVGLILEEADRNLYAAKRAGRNRVIGGGPT